MRRKFVALSTGLLFASPAMALTDEATGLGVDPPAPFVAKAVAHPPQVTTVFSISTTPDAPETSANEMGSKDECSLTFRALPDNVSATQAEINKVTESAEYGNLTRANLSAAFDLSEPGSIKVDGASAVELTGRLKAGAKQDFSIYSVSLQIPKGVVQLLCFSSPTRIQGAIPQFKAIRDTIKLPR